MSVYVDSPTHRYGRMLMCHMIADSREELFTMAVLIGVGKRWVQHAGTYREHFDVCKSRREKAIAFGAIEVDSRTLVKMLRERVRPQAKEKT